MIKEISSSKTIWGISGLIAILAPRLFGVEIAQTEIMSYIEAIGAGIFAVLALYGRLVANGPILKTEEQTTSEIVYGGAIDGISDSDWIFGEAVDPSDLPEVELNFEKNKIQYNQNNEIGSNSCTLAASMGAISDLTGIRWTENQMRDVYKVAVAEGLDPSVGWYTHKAVDLVRKKTKEHLGLDVNFATFEMGNEGLRKSLLSKGYSIVTGYLGNSAYNKDKNDNGVVSAIHKPTTYGHAIRRIVGARIVDNYFGIKFNVYENDLVDEMLKEGTQHKWGFVYFIVGQENLKEKVWIRKRVSGNWVERWISKDSKKRVRNGINEVRIGGFWFEYKSSV